jgi:hypothetical protein
VIEQDGTDDAQLVLADWYADQDAEIISADLRQSINDYSPSWDYEYSVGGVGGHGSVGGVGGHSSVGYGGGVGGVSGVGGSDAVGGVGGVGGVSGVVGGHSSVGGGS